MKRILAVAFAVCAAVAGIAAAGPEPVPAPNLALDAPAALARPLADALAGCGIAVFLPPDATPDGSFAAFVGLRSPAVTRVRSAASDSPASETLCVQRAALNILDPAGKTVFADTVSAPGPDPSVLVAPLAARIFSVLLP